MRQILAILFIFLMVMGAVAAQDDESADDVATDGFISYGQTVEDTITARSTFDRFTFVANGGDIIRVTMVAADGLAPLVGISDPSRDVIARSDRLNADGEALPDAEVDSTATLEFVVPQAGEYAVVASRVGLADGDTTGSYTLTLERTGTTSADDGPGLQAMDFRCESLVANTLLTVEFPGRPGDDVYQFSVYGLDGLIPLPDFVAMDGDAFNCTRDFQKMPGDRYIWPGEDARVVPETGENPPFAQMGVSGAEILEIITLTLGGLQDAYTGRYMLVIDGLSLALPGEEDAIRVRLGPLAVESTITVYMVAYGRTRIDPVIVYEIDDETTIVCDDAGGRGCEDVPSFEGAGVIQDFYGKAILGDRLDAGFTYAPGTVDPGVLIMSSRNENATGPYAIVIIGEVPEPTLSTDDEG